MMFLKKAVHGKLAEKVNNIDTNDLVLKTKYQNDKTEFEKKIPDLTDFVKKTKLTELGNKILDISSFATKTALAAVEIKIPSASSLVKKKQTMPQNLVSLEGNLLITIVTNILLLQNLIFWLLVLLTQDWHKQI